MRRQNNYNNNNNRFNQFGNQQRDQYDQNQQYADQEASSGYTSGTSSGYGTNNNRGGRSTRSWGKKPMARTNVTSNHPIPTKPPAGQYLSKVASDVQNDPLAEKAYFSAPSEEFKRVADRQKIYSGCEIFPQLCEQTYIKASCLSPSYGKTVPRSAHDYFLGVLVNYRLLQLEKLNGRQLSYEEDQFLDQIQSSSFTVPKSFSMYLSGFGNTKIPKGRELEFKMHHPTLLACEVVDGNDSWRIPGYFGSMETAMGQYAAYPATGIMAQRILEDLRKTANHQLPANWDLPVPIRYAKPVNSNCLGYVHAKQLSAEHQMFYANVNLSLLQYEFDNQEVALNIEVMTAVHQKLLYTKQTLYPLPTSVNGSVGQICVEVVDTQTTSVAVRATFRGQSNSEMPSSEGYLGTTFLYNMLKAYDQLAVVKTLLPVTFRVNDAVPLNLRALLNFNYMNSSRTLHIKSFETIGFSPSIRLEDVVRLDSKVDS